MNDTIPKAEQWLRDHDAEVRVEGRAEAVAEIRDRLIGFVSRLKEAAQTQLEAVNLMETMLMDKPAAPVRRKRAPTVATEEQVSTVRCFIDKAHSHCSIKYISEQTNIGTKTVADACEQLKDQGYIKPVQRGIYRWIPEAEAERENGSIMEELENGPVMIDDIKEQEDV